MKKTLEKQYPIVEIVDTTPSTLLDGKHTIECRVLGKDKSSNFFMEVGDTLELKQ